MDEPLDPMSTRLRGIAAPAALDTLEDEVFAAIGAAAREASVARRAGMLSVGAALVLGALSGGFAGGAAAPVAAMPIGVDAALAPSTLLLGR